MSLKTNIKRMKKPELSDEDIRSHMNFDKLLQSYQQSNLTAGRIPKWVILTSAGLVGVTIIYLVTYFYSQNSSYQNHPQSIEPKKIADSVSTAHEINTVVEKQEVPKKNSTKTALTPLRSSKIERRGNLKKDSTVIESKTISKFTEAIPVDGYPALYSYFDRELKYPGSPKDSIQGVVTVSFAVSETGKPDQIKIENSLGAVFDAECIRLIENMPLWKPATINNKPVRTRLSIPLSFKIKK